MEDMFDCLFSIIVEFYQDGKKIVGTKIQQFFRNLNLLKENKKNRAAFLPTLIKIQIL